MYLSKPILIPIHREWGLGVVIKGKTIKYDGIKYYKDVSFEIEPDSLYIEKIPFLWKK
ncbi:MAG: hypothetical protein ACPG4Z_07225 [Chitinophagales bacterium]